MFPFAEKHEVWLIRGGASPNKASKLYRPAQSPNLDFFVIGSKMTQVINFGNNHKNKFSFQFSWEPWRSNVRTLSWHFWVLEQKIAEMTQTWQSFPHNFSQIWLSLLAWFWHFAPKKMFLGKMSASNKFAASVGGWRKLWEVAVSWGCRILCGFLVSESPSET